MLTVQLVRHFQTPCSAADRFCGDCPTGLTEAGAAMARALAAAHAGPDLVAVYASPLPRAHASATPLAQACGLPVLALPGVEEIRYGQWENLSPGAARAADPAAYAAWRAQPADAAAPGGETGRAVADRAVAALARVTAAHASGRVLVVSHKATLRLLLCAWLGIPVAHFRARLAQPWGALSTIEMAPEGPQVLALNDRAYLGALATPPALGDGQAAALAEGLRRDP